MLAGILFEILIVFQVLEQCAILRNTLLVELFFAFEQTNSVANFDHSDQITPDKEERKDDDQRRQRHPKSFSELNLHTAKVLAPN